MSRKYEFSIGEKVRIKTGVFHNFTGEVVEINKQTGMLKVRVNIFGRAQPVDLTFLDVEKIDR